MNTELTTDEREEAVRVLYECITEITNHLGYRNPVAERAGELARRLDREGSNAN